MRFTSLPDFLAKEILLHIFMRNHYAPRENPCHSFPVTRIMPISSLRSVVLPLVTWRHTVMLLTSPCLN